MKKDNNKNDINVWRKIVIKMINEMDNLESLKRIYNLVEYLYLKKAD